MERSKLHQDIQTWALALTLFTFPFRPLLLNNICVIILGLNWLAQGNFRLKFSRLAKNKIALAFVGLYVVLIISFFLSEDKTRAAVILERNLFLLLVPLILATSGITRSDIEKTFYSLVAGCLLGAVICLIHATYKYSTSHETHHLFYHDLSKPLELHAVYFSLYIAVCVLFLIIQLEKKWIALTWRYRVWYIGLILFFCGFVLLLTSKTIIIGLTLSINLLFFMWMIKRSKLLTGVLAIVVINIAIVIGIFKIDYVKTRFLDSINSNIEFIKRDTYSELTVFTGVTVRITFWKFVLEVLNENDRWWMGMSIGDGDRALSQKAIEKNLFSGDKERGWTDYTSYNAHNQYFQYLLLIGVIGLGYFMFMVGLILWHALKYKKVLLLLTTLLFMLFCFTESVLVVNKGIIFFSVIPMLLMHSEAKD